MKNTVKLIVVAIIIAISSINLNGQTTISDSYADYSIIETKQTNAYGKEKDEQAFAIFQMETKRYTDNYWHSILTINKPEDVYNYLIEIRNSVIELDSINKLNNIDKETKELNNLKSNGTNCIAKLSSKYSSNNTWAVTVYSTYYYTQYGSRIMINFMNRIDDRPSSVKLSLKLNQLDNFIETLNKIK